MPRLTDLDDIRARLEHDRPWAAFSLADLDPPYATHATWFGPDDGSSVVLLYDAYDPPIVICHGAAQECAAPLADGELVRRSQSAYLNVMPDMLPLVSRHFARFEQRRMVRMLLDTARGLPVPSSPVARLGLSDLDDVRALYAEEPPAFFLPMQLANGVYYGVRDGRDLIAIAGTHVVSSAARVGAIGNVHTRRDRRRQGLAADVTAAVAGELLRAGISTIVLNIVGTNDTARRVYERIGFRDYCIYYEGLACR